VSQIPRPNPVSTPLHKQTYRSKPDENATMDVGNNYDTPLSDFNVEVRIEQSIMRDARPPDEETTEPELYTPSKPVTWDETQGSYV
jgi:hypothetical protein